MGSFNQKYMVPKTVMAHLRIDKEWDPADDDEQAGGEIVGHDVEWHLPRKNQLKKSMLVAKSLQL